MTGRIILGVDPGDKRIGLAISDPTGTIANPISVIRHSSRTEDARAIKGLSLEREVNLIVIGLSTDSEGRPSHQGKKAERLAQEMRLITDIPVVMWDESNSTQIARQARINMGVPRKKRRGHMDDLAAVVMLQDFLDSRREI